MIKPSLFFFIWPTIGLLGFLVALGGGYWYLKSSKVECWVQQAPERAPCPTDLQLQLQPLRNQALLGSDFSSQVTQLLDQHDSPYELQHIRKTLSGELVLTLAQDPFQYQLVDRTSQQAWLVTEHGWLRTIESSGSAQIALPRISQTDVTAQLLSEGRQAPTATHELTTRLLQALDLYALQYQEVILYDPVTTVVKLNDTQQLLLENDAVLENLEKFRLLQTHPEQISTPGQIVEYDVRFKLPVLRTHTSIAL